MNYDFSGLNDNSSNNNKNNDDDNDTTISSGFSKANKVFIFYNVCVCQ